MKKIFLLLCLFLCVMTSSWAEDHYNVKIIISGEGGDCTDMLPYETKTLSFNLTDEKGKPVTYDYDIIWKKKGKIIIGAQNKDQYTYKAPVVTQKEEEEVSLEIIRKNSNVVLCSDRVTFTIWPNPTIEVKLNNNKTPLSSNDENSLGQISQGSTLSVTHTGGNESENNWTYSWTVYEKGEDGQYETLFLTFEESSITVSNEFLEGSSYHIHLVGTNSLSSCRDQEPTNAFDYYFTVVPSQQGEYTLDMNSVCPDMLPNEMLSFNLIDPEGNSVDNFAGYKIEWTIVPENVINTDDEKLSCTALEVKEKTEANVSLKISKDGVEVASDNTTLHIWPAITIIVYPFTEENSEDSPVSINKGEELKVEHTGGNGSGDWTFDWSFDPAVNAESSNNTSRTIDDNFEEGTTYHLTLTVTNEISDCKPWTEKLNYCFTVTSTAQSSDPTFNKDLLTVETVKDDNYTYRIVDYDNSFHMPEGGKVKFTVPVINDNGSDFVYDGILNKIENNDLTPIPGEFIHENNRLLFTSSNPLREGYYKFYFVIKNGTTLIDSTEVKDLYVRKIGVTSDRMKSDNTSIEDVFANKLSLSVDRNDTFGIWICQWRNGNSIIKSDTIKSDNNSRIEIVQGSTYNWEEEHTITLHVKQIVYENAGDIICWTNETLYYEFKFMYPKIVSITPINNKIYKGNNDIYHLPSGEITNFEITLEGPSENEINNFDYIICNSKYTIDNPVPDNKTITFTYNNCNEIKSDTDFAVSVYPNGSQEGDHPLDSKFISLKVHNFPELNESETTKGYSEVESTAALMTYYKDEATFTIWPNEVTSEFGKWKHNWEVINTDSLGNDQEFTLKVSKDNNKKIKYGEDYIIKNTIYYDPSANPSSNESIKWFEHTYYYKVKLDQTKINSIEPVYDGARLIEEKNQDGKVEKYHAFVESGKKLKYVIDVDTLTLPDNWKGYYIINPNATIPVVTIPVSELDKDENGQKKNTITTDGITIQDVNNITAKINNSSKINATVIGHNFKLEEGKDPVNITPSTKTLLDITENSITFTATGAPLDQPLPGNGDKWEYKWTVVDNNGETVVDEKTCDSYIIKVTKDNIEYEKEYCLKMNAIYYAQKNEKDPSKNIIWKVLEKSYDFKFVKPKLTIGCEIVNEDDANPVEIDDQTHVLEGTIVQYTATVKNLPVDCEGKYTFNDNPVEVTSTQENNETEFVFIGKLEKGKDNKFELDLTGGITGDKKADYIVHTAPTINSDEMKNSIEWPLNILTVDEIPLNHKSLSVDGGTPDPDMKNSIGCWKYKWTIGDKKNDNIGSIYDVKAVADIPYDSVKTVQVMATYYPDKEEDVIWEEKTFYYKLKFIKPELTIEPIFSAAVEEKKQVEEESIYVLKEDNGEITYYAKVSNLPVGWENNSNYTFNGNTISVNSHDYDKENNRFTITKKLADLEQGEYVFSMNLYGGIEGSAKKIIVCDKPKVTKTAGLYEKENDVAELKVEEDVTLSVETNQPLYGKWEYTWQKDGETINDTDSSIVLKEGDYGIKYGEEYLVTLTISYDVPSWFQEEKTYYYKVIFKHDESHMPDITLSSNHDDVGKNYISGDKVNMSYALNGNNKDYKITWNVAQEFTAENETGQKPEEVVVSLTLEPTDNSIVPKTVSDTIYVWPAANIIKENATFLLTDSVNFRNSKITTGVREGNKFSITNDGVIFDGGYGDNSNWSIVTVVNDKESTYYTASLIGEANPSKYKVEWIAQNKYKNGSIMFEETLFTKEFMVYGKPANPVMFERKGNGTSNTWIVKDFPNDVTDVTLDMVYGSVTKIDTIAVSIRPNKANDGMSWFRPVEDDNSSYKDKKDLCIYYVKDYGNGVKITSDLLMLKGSKPVTWDGSVYESSGSREAEVQPAPSFVPEGTYSINGMKTDGLVRGLNIIRMEDGTVKKVFKK